MTTVFLPFLFILTSALAPPENVTLGQEFDVRVGQWVTIEGERLRVTFDCVAEDSRCPEGVQCIWAGNAKIVLRLSKGRKRSSTMSLNTGTDPKEASYRGYEVRLVKLEPYPKEKRRIRKRDFVASLVVERR